MEMILLLMISESMFKNRRYVLFRLRRTIVLQEHLTPLRPIYGLIIRRLMTSRIRFFINGGMEMVKQ